MTPGRLPGVRGWMTKMISVPGRRSAVAITVRYRLSEDTVVEIGIFAGLKGPRSGLSRGMRVVRRVAARMRIPAVCASRVAAVRRINPQSSKSGAFWDEPWGSWHRARMRRWRRILTRCARAWLHWQGLRNHILCSSHPDILNYVDEKDVRLMNDDAASSRWLPL